MVVLFDVSLADIAITLVTLVQFPVLLILVTALTSNNLQISMTLRAGVYTVAGRSFINRCAVWLLKYAFRNTVCSKILARTLQSGYAPKGCWHPLPRRNTCTLYRPAHPNVTFLPLKLLAFVAEKTAPVLLHESW